MNHMGGVFENEPVDPVSRTEWVTKLGKKATRPVYPTDTVNAGKLIRELREKSDMTVSVAARCLGLAPNDLAAMEMGAVRLKNLRAALKQMAESWRKP